MDGQPLTASGHTDDNGLPVYEATPGRHSFEFHYTGLTFDAPERIQFRYQLEGWDQDWVEAGDDRVARYNIPPGNYRFRVIACNSGGLWNEVGAGLALLVLPTLWQSLWFKIVIGLILLGLLALIIRRIERGRYRARLRRLEQEHAMQNERARIARDLHDELGSSLTYISMSVNDLEPGDGEPFKKHKEKISAFATRTARSLDEIVWAINPVNDSLRNLLAYLTQFTREHFEGSGVNCRFQIPDDLPELPLPPEMRHNIFLAVKEALNNALKYARATEVVLAAKPDGALVEISVQDNGTGFDPGSRQARQDRNGLSNMRQRMEKLGGKFSLETAPGKGTMVRLTVRFPTAPGAEAKT
jgi:signal transduction histidine kinase